MGEQADKKSQERQEKNPIRSVKCVQDQSNACLVMDIKKALLIMRCEAWAAHDTLSQAVCPSAIKTWERIVSYVAVDQGAWIVFPPLGGLFIKVRRSGV